MKNKKTIIAIVVGVVILAAICILCLCVIKKNNNSNGNILPKDAKTVIVYFSNTGTTKTIANYIASVNNADVISLEPVVPYTAEDTANNANARATLEQNDKNARPSIKNNIDLSEYDVIYLGYPIWYSGAPKIIYTLLDQNDLKDKYIVPFCTSSSSDIKQTVSALKKYKPEAKWLEGKRFGTKSTQSDVTNWVKSL